MARKDGKDCDRWEHAKAGARLSPALGAGAAGYANRQRRLDRSALTRLILSAGDSRNLPS